MDIDCPLLTELDAWFSLALDVLDGVPEVRRDVLLLVGGAGRAEHVAAVTWADCVEVAGHVVVYPPNARGHALPLTPDFVEVTGLSPDAWPDKRADAAADAAAVEAAIEAVDGALARITGVVRTGGADRLRELRMHAWRHELGSHVGVLARFYGSELKPLLECSGDCPATRADREISDLVPSPRGPRRAVVAA
jgi:hypothetical protein